MILLLFCLCVLLMLFAWKLCLVAGEADDRMEAAFQKMMQEKERGSKAIGDDPPEKEDAHAG